MSQHIWHYSWRQARNSQECINSTTGVVLTPEVQPEPDQAIGSINGTDVFALFATPSQSQVPILLLGMLEQWG